MRRISIGIPEVQPSSDGSHGRDHYDANQQQRRRSATASNRICAPHFPTLYFTVQAACMQLEITSLAQLAQLYIGREYQCVAPGRFFSSTHFSNFAASQPVAESRVRLDFLPQSAE